MVKLCLATLLKKISSDTVCSRSYYVFFFFGVTFEFKGLMAQIRIHLIQIAANFNNLFIRITGYKTRKGHNDYPCGSIYPGGLELRVTGE